MIVHGVTRLEIYCMRTSEGYERGNIETWAEKKDFGRVTRGCFARILAIADQVDEFMPISQTPWATSRASMWLSWDTSFAVRFVERVVIPSKVLDKGLAAPSGCRAAHVLKLLRRRPGISTCRLLPQRVRSFSSTMLLTLAPVVVGLLPFVAEAKVHKLKLQKLTSAPSNPQLESSWLAEKYGAPAQPQAPLMGAGGAGRRIARPSQQNGETLFWTQEEQAQGGHHVPLTSQSNVQLSTTFTVTLYPRLHECAVFH